MKDVRAVTSLTVVCFVLGVIIAMQLKAVNKQNINPVSLQRASEISVVLDNALLEKEALAVKLKETEDRLLEFEEVAASTSRSSKVMLAELEEARMLAGLTALSGRGVSITLHDSKKVIDPSVEKSVLLIHDEDILSILNELSAAGCEAVSINDQRVVSVTAVRCIGPVISVNGTKIAAPYTITAIGDPDVLESALKLPGGVVNNLLPWGIEVNIKKMQNVIVPPYHGILSFTEAKRAESGENGK